MSNKVFETYKELPSWAKGIVVVGGLLVAYMVGNNLYKKIFPSQANVDAKKQQDSIEADLNTIKSNGITPSYPQSQFDSWVTTIVDAISGCDYSAVLIWSFGFQKVYDIFDFLKNDADFLTLEKTFGIKTISKGVLCGGNYTNVSFTQAMSAQFNTLEIGLLNSRLSSKGISYRLTN